MVRWTSRGKESNRVLVLSAEDVRRALSMRAAIDTQKRAFVALATGQAELPLRTAVPVPAESAVTLVMPARVGGDLGAKLVSVFPHNQARGIPLLHGLLVLIDATTGQPAAVMDATYLTALRTGAVSGLATELLAAPEAGTAAILGTGVQAGTQLLAICAVRPIHKVWVFSRDPEHVAAFIARMQPEVAATLTAAPSPNAAVREADVVCAATTSATPIFEGRALRTGAHVNGIGSYTLQMQEVDTETVRRAGRVFVDCRPAALVEAGDAVLPLRAGVIAETDLIELGAVASGQHPGRTSRDEITFFKGVGIAVQDVAIGGEVLRRAREKGLGTEIWLGPPAQSC
jgi:ornithine cyclodeaminase/alanine dehydrogenase-like protein (mu-crystallin family)